MFVLFGCVEPTAPPAPAEQPRAPAAQSPAPEAAPATAAATTPQIAIPNASMPLPGVLTGGQPSDENLRQAKAAGYKLVVSLLPEAETVDEAKLAQELGLRFVSIPVSGAADVTEDNARKLASAMNAPDASPMIIHCGSGNRVGALLALKAVYVDGQSVSDALALGERAGLRSLRSVVEAKLDDSPGK